MNDTNKVATITIEFDDGTVAHTEIDDDHAEIVGTLIEALVGQQMSMKT